MISRLHSVCVCCGYCDLMEEIENNPNYELTNEDALILLHKEAEDIDADIKQKEV